MSRQTLETSAGVEDVGRDHGAEDPLVIPDSPETGHR